MITQVKKITGCVKLLALCLLFSQSVAAIDQGYGDAVSDAEPIRIAALSANPDLYVGKLVKVEGLVEDVCPMKGCWVDILEQQSTETIRFKVQDDVIVFPAAARGQQIIAEGYLRKHEMSEKQAVKWLRHLADEKGEDFDDASVTGPMTFYQIEGSGAVLQGRI